MALITSVTDAEVAIFLEKYGVSRLEQVTPLAAGSVNSNFRIRADEKDFFLRIYEEQGLQGAIWDAELVAELAAANVPTPPPIPRDFPFRSYILELARKPAALFPWRDGEIICQRGVSADHTRAVGAALASVHLAGDRFATWPGQGRFGFTQLSSRIDDIERAADTRIAHVAPHLRKRLAACNAARSSDLPQGLVHGDLFRDNVLFAENEKPPRLVALLDFESAFKGAFIFDVMVTMLAWCVGDAIDFDLARALTDGYQSVRPLTDDEKKYAFHEARFASLRFWITRVTDYAMRLGFGNGRDPGRFEMRLDQIEALGAEKFEAALF